MLAVQVRVQLVGLEAAELAEEVADVGVGAVEALGHRVDLAAVAGREDDDLADVLPGAEGVDDLGERVGREGDALEHLEKLGAIFIND